MTRDEIHADLAAGKISRDLDAAICVALQYVPNVADAENIMVYQGNMIEFTNSRGAHLYDRAPPLTSDLNAVMALEKAKGGETRLELSELKSERCYAARWPIGLGFTASTEIHARLGALLKLVERNTP